MLTHMISGTEQPFCSNPDSAAALSEAISTPPKHQSKWKNAVLVFIVSSIVGGWGAMDVFAAPRSLDLSGKWSFSMDSADRGVKEEFFKKSLQNSIRLPGSMADSGYGAPQPPTPQRAWGVDHPNPTWYPVRRHAYMGAAWYQRSFEVPAEWKGEFLRLFLERVCWKSDVWIDDKHVGRRDSLSAPHQYNLGVLPPGKHRLTIRVDNRELHDIGCNTHAYHEQSGTIYNGIIGKLTITARPRVFAENTQVFTDVETGLCEVHTRINNTSRKDAAGKLAIKIMKSAGGEVLAAASVPFAAKPGMTEFTASVQVPVEKIELWGEFSHPLYTAEIDLASSFGNDRTSISFGFREFTGHGPQFHINGRPVMMRGEVSNAMFPLTGYPPMGKAEWLKILGLYRQFGLNHLRCHSWTPPEAAFQAADELGVFLQPELPNGEDAIKDPVGNEWRIAEFDRILETYGNHPSFVLMSMGNEAKIRDYTFLKMLVRRGIEKDPRHLYATISNPEAGGFKDECPGDQFAVAHGSRKGRRRMEPYFNRQAPETMGDYRHTMAGRPVPQIGHEVGQWYVFPDVSEIEKFKGALDPVNLKYFKKQLARNGLLARAADFVDASGRLSLLLYKEEIERSLRTPRYGGFQLLGLQDSFDQGSAYVGQINNFFEPKPYVTAGKFRRFCAPEVLLARFAKRVWLNNESFSAKLEIANYGPKALKDATVRWRLSGGKTTVGSGVFSLGNIPNDGLRKIGGISCPLAKVKAAEKLNLSVEIDGTRIANDWDIWVYPAELEMPAPDNVLVVNELNAGPLKKLRAGARVLLLPRGFKSPYTTAMTPPFWSPIMFSNQKQSIGFLCDPRHPAFADFPTDSYNNWQWFELTKNGAAMHLTGSGDIKPIVQAIDRPDRCHRLGIIYEGRVGNGKLIVCTLDLERDLENRPVARQLRRSLVNYAAGDAFDPKEPLDVERDIPVGEKVSVLAGLSTKVSADSEHENNWAVFAVDGNRDTIWATRYDGTQTPHPHHITIELPEMMAIKGIVQTPRKDCENGMIAKYRVFTSADGKSWKLEASGEWGKSHEPKTAMFKSPATCRFIKLEALSEVNGQPWTTVAEIDVIP